MNTASFRCSVRIRGGIPRDLEGRGGDSCPTRLRGSGLLLSTPCCIGSRRGGRIGCRGRVGACGRLLVWPPRPGCASVCEVGCRRRCFGRFVPFGATGIQNQQKPSVWWFYGQLCWLRRGSRRQRGWPCRIGSGVTRLDQLSLLACCSISCQLLVP